VKIRLVVEIDNEDLIAWIGVFHQVERRDGDLLSLVPHAAATVDNESKRNLDILSLEQLQRLQDTVFIHLESRLRQISHQVRALVLDRYTERHQAGLAAESGSLVLRHRRAAEHHR